MRGVVFRLRISLRIRIRIRPTVLIRSAIENSFMLYVYIHVCMIKPSLPTLPTFPTTLPTLSALPTLPTLPSLPTLPTFQICLIHGH